MRDRLIAARSTDLCAAYRFIVSAALSTDCANHSNVRNTITKNYQKVFGNCTHRAVRCRANLQWSGPESVPRSVLTSVWYSSLIS